MDVFKILNGQLNLEGQSIIGFGTGTSNDIQSGGSLFGNTPGIGFPDTAGTIGNGVNAYIASGGIGDTQSRIGLILDGYTVIQGNFDTSDNQSFILFGATAAVSVSPLITSGTVALGQSNAWWSTTHTQRVNLNPTSSIGAAGYGPIIVVNGPGNGSTVMYITANTTSDPSGVGGNGTAWSFPMYDPTQTYFEAALTIQLQSSPQVGGLVQSACESTSFNNAPLPLTVKGGNADNIALSQNGANLYASGGDTSGNGSNTGGHAHLMGGSGLVTGTNGGNAIISGGSPGSGGTYGNTLVIAGGSQALLVDPSQNVIAGSNAVTTSSNSGFFYIPASSGAPTGTPTTYSGFVAMYYDTSNHEFWIYDTATSTWKGIILI